MRSLFSETMLHYSSTTAISTAQLALASGLLVTSLGTAAASVETYSSGRSGVSVEVRDLTDHGTSRPVLLRRRGVNTLRMSAAATALVALVAFLVLVCFRMMSQSGAKVTDRKLAVGGGDHVHEDPCAQPLPDVDSHESIDNAGGEGSTSDRTGPVEYIIRTLRSPLETNVETTMLAPFLQRTEVDDFDALRSCLVTFLVETFTIADDISKILPNSPDEFYGRNAALKSFMDRSSLACFVLSAMPQPSIRYAESVAAPVTLRHGSPRDVLKQHQSIVMEPVPARPDPGGMSGLLEASGRQQSYLVEQVPAQASTDGEPVVHGPSSHDHSDPTNQVIRILEDTSNIGASSALLLPIIRTVRPEHLGGLISRLIKFIWETSLRIRWLAAVHSDQRSDSVAALHLPAVRLFFLVQKCLTAVFLLSVVPGVSPVFQTRRYVFANRDFSGASDLPGGRGQSEGERTDAASELSPGGGSGQSEGERTDTASEVSPGGGRGQSEEERTDTASEVSPGGGRGQSEEESTDTASELSPWGDLPK